MIRTRRTLAWSLILALLCASLTIAQRPPSARAAANTYVVDNASDTDLTGAACNSGVADDDLDPSCGLGNALDQAIRFTAPVASTYTFDTFGSGFDTVLSVWSDCSTESVCNDDSGGLQSQASLDLAAGQAVLVLVDGYNGATGDWVLNISG